MLCHIFFIYIYRILLLLMQGITNHLITSVTFSVNFNCSNCTFEKIIPIKTTLIVNASAQI